MLFSRGCPFNCYYCSRPSISRTIRYRSTANLIKEIKYCYPFCNGKINFQDDTFTLNKDKVVKLCKTLIKEKIKICDDVVIGLNGGVVKNIYESGIYVGVPVTKIRNL